jgi:hypothetical protein
VFKVPKALKVSKALVSRVPLVMSKVHKALKVCLFKELKDFRVDKEPRELLYKVHRVFLVVLLHGFARLQHILQ